jgi:hypothetical protein
MSELLRLDFFYNGEKIDYIIGHFDVSVFVLVISIFLFLFVLSIFIKR